MRILLLSALLAVLAVAAGCVAEKPMTATEFRGNCYQSNSSRKSDCDSISVCEAYSSVVNAEGLGLDVCLSQCTKISEAQSRQHVTDGCAAIVDSGSEWCTRFCRTNYPGAGR
jgi:hypothetical protein